MSFHVAESWGVFMRKVKRIAIRGNRALTHAYPVESENQNYMRVMRYLVCEAVRDFLQNSVGGMENRMTWMRILQGMRQAEMNFFRKDFEQNPVMSHFYEQDHLWGHFSEPILQQWIVKMTEVPQGTTWQDNPANGEVNMIGSVRLELQNLRGRLEFGEGAVQVSLDREEFERAFGDRPWPEQTPKPPCNWIQCVFSD